MLDNKKIIKAVLGYFNCLIACDAIGAAGYCCKSWRDANDDAWVKFYLHSFNGLVDVAVIEVKYNNNNSTFATVRVLVDDGIEEREYVINALCEIDPYVLSIDGDWGVNPISLRGI